MQQITFEFFQFKFLQRCPLAAPIRYLLPHALPNDQNKRDDAQNYLVRLADFRLLRF
jgi:hypothetical protein